MKKILLILLLATINVGIYAMSDGNTAKPASANATFCYNGGVGAASCSIDAGITIGGGVSAACSVSCREGYYACCSLRCRCISSDFAIPDEPEPCVGC